MRDILSEFISVGEHDTITGAPCVFLELKAPPELSLALPYKVEFILRRAENEPFDRPCIVSFRPSIEAFGSSGLIIVQHNDDGSDVQQLQIPQGALDGVSSEDKAHPTAHETDFQATLAPGGVATFTVELPQGYSNLLQAGATYTLVYPGGRLPAWKWSSDGEDAKVAEVEALPTLVVPGGAHATFKVESKETTEDVRARRWKVEQAVFNMMFECESDVEPVRPHERVVGAPVLSVTLECAPTFKPTDKIQLVARVTYDGVAGRDGSIEKSAQPITFRAWSVLHLDEDILRHGFRLYLRRPVAADDEGDWEECLPDPDANEGYRIYDGPDVSVSVATYKNFTSLRPGESWTGPKYFDTILPDELVPGDVFCCGFKGGVADWWDWGSAEDHKDTVVELPSYLAGKVTNPSDNEGRPELVVTASQPIQFRIVG